MAAADVERFVESTFVTRLNELDGIFSLKEEQPHLKPLLIKCVCRTYQYDLVKV